jgi:hypothetical protein
MINTDLQAETLEHLPGLSSTARLNGEQRQIDQWVFLVRDRQAITRITWTINKMQ